MQYSITRALAEIKVLEKRYISGVNDLNLVAVKHGLILRKPNSSIKPEDFDKKAKAGDQSVIDLEKRISLIKRKIAEVNSTTEVKIGSKKMTIQEALIEKSVILPLKKDRLAKYKRLLSEARVQFQAAIDDNDERIRERIRDAKDMISEEQAKNEIEAVRAVSMIDPLNLSEKIKELEDDITEFEGNVDFALSEINSTTLIEIPD